jgi:hemolysin D
MQLLPRPSSTAISAPRDDRLDPTLPAILEFQSPSSAIINLPMPRIARKIALTFSSMIVLMLIAAGLIKVDRVVTASGLVVARAPTVVVQPLEASTLRSIEVHPGDVVHAGQILARLDPTFATADMGTLVAAADKAFDVSDQLSDAAERGSFQRFAGQD